MHSLAGRLTLAFLFVGLSGALLVALLARWQTERQFDRFIEDRNQAEIAELQQQLQAYYVTYGSWDGIRVLIRGRPQWVTLADADGWVVITTKRGNPFHQGDDVQPGDRLSAEELAYAVPVKVDGRVVGWLLPQHDEEGPAVYGGSPTPDSDEGQFLRNVTVATFWSAIGATGLALVVGAVLAQTVARPLQELTVATEAVAQGKLGEQVTVHGQDEISNLARAFNRMSADLARATALRRQMTADIAHDLRTPLTALLGYTEALNEGKFQGSPAIYATLYREAHHLGHLIEDLRTLSLADAGELPLLPRPTAPAALLEQVAQSYRVQAIDKGISLKVEASPTLPVLNVDPQRLTQVLGNLLQNALRYTPTGGAVTLSAALQETNNALPSVQLQVRDSGSGIAPDDLPFIWERSYRGDKARAQEGSGLGLAIARSIVEAHGGTIAVASVVGQGSTFTITLPTTA